MLDLLSLTHTHTHVCTRSIHEIDWCTWQSKVKSVKSSPYHLHLQVCRMRGLRRQELLFRELLMLHPVVLPILTEGTFWGVLVELYLNQKFLFYVLNHLGIH